MRRYRRVVNVYGFVYKRLMRFIVILLICALSWPVMAQDSNMIDVDVDATAANAVRARALAFEKGAAAALGAYYERTGRDAAAAQAMSNPEQYIDYFQVLNEQFTRTRYTARLRYAMDITRTRAPEPEPLSDPDAPYAPPQTPTTAALNTWEIDVRFPSVTVWLGAQTRLMDDPMTRGMVVRDLSGTSARVVLTSAASADSFAQSWQSLGWTITQRDNGFTIAAP